MGERNAVDGCGTYRRAFIDNLTTFRPISRAEEVSLISKRRLLVRSAGLQGQTSALDLRLVPQP